MYAPTPILMPTFKQLADISEDILDITISHEDSICVEYQEPMLIITVTQTASGIRTKQHLVILESTGDHIAYSKLTRQEQNDIIVNMHKRMLALSRIAYLTGETLYSIGNIIKAARNKGYGKNEDLD